MYECPFLIRQAAAFSGQCSEVLTSPRLLAWILRHTLIKTPFPLDWSGFEGSKTEYPLRCKKQKLAKYEFNYF